MYVILACIFQWPPARSARLRCGPGSAREAGRNKRNRGQCRNSPTGALRLQRSRPRNNHSISGGMSSWESGGIPCARVAPGTPADIAEVGVASPQPHQSAQVALPATFARSDAVYYELLPRGTSMPGARLLYCALEKSGASGDVADTATPILICTRLSRSMRRSRERIARAGRVGLCLKPALNAAMIWQRS